MSTPVQSWSRIQNLPPEIITEIFLFAVTPFPTPRFSVHRRQIIPSFEVTAMVISHISRDWRQIAFSRPDVWSWMIMGSPTRGCIELVKHHLSLTGDTQLLDLSFEDCIESVKKRGPDAAQIERECTKELFDIWIGQSHRWRSVNFRFEDIFVPSRLLEVSPENIQSLRSANVQGAGTRRNFLLVAMKLWDAFHRSPVLHEVNWAGLAGRLLPSAPLVQITHIELPFAFTIGGLLDILPSLPQLQCLRGSLGYGVDDDDDAHLQHLPLIHARYQEIFGIPNLQQMQLKSRSYGISTLLLNLLKAPSLRDLCVGVPDDDPSALREFLLRSRCRLQELCLVGSPHHIEETFVECLRISESALPSLEVLKLDFPHKISTTTIVALTPQTEDGQVRILLPSIVDLRLGRGGIVSDGLVSKMVLSRSIHGAPLFVFEARMSYTGQGGHPKDTEAFVEMRSRGLKVLWDSTRSGWQAYRRSKLRG
ncbi:hypothetical protein BDN72DRAFT_202262 [Pluteus cervinus]|uniref:Uncharacterized protein n=1 Tax=Pluteus cervinus TaxID=181527 RepID=A0ACD3B750_9AGAR|nr:hypothetical protein BDN72DRAFT_202262 [Pluteus cervinus]